ncbi:hypothetical protein E0500_026735 [Streptomyces sp. KM273126]|uniref:hypothetical protein n=1 Tax=Streptomyces sp. KM273126 TaxID=2545247 RepID=UPI00103FB446|nr:hypothetical protein [Streptomyces sp. KM273126]MBA2810897.1 hypothetical protein [Streptomyces sp. KM273126]
MCSSLPILGISGAAVALKAFGLSVLLLVGYPFALAGHYDMFNPRTGRTLTSDGKLTYCPPQERNVLYVVAVAVVAYIVLASAR